MTYYNFQETVMLALKKPAAEHVVNHKGPWIISSIADGRFMIDSDFNIYDRESNIRYLRDKAIPLESLAFVDIDGLTVTDSPLSLVYLFTLAVKPLTHIPDTVLTAVDNGIGIRVTSGNFVGSPTQVYWTWPTTGVLHADQTSSSYVPYATSYIVDDAGVIRDQDTETILRPGDLNNGMIEITADNGNVVEIEAARLVLLAFGKYTLEDWTKDIIYVDGDSTNVALSNMTVTETTQTDKSVELAVGSPGYRR